MKPMKATNESEAMEEACSISLQKPGQYVEVFTCFGLFAGYLKRLSVQTVGDSRFDWYALNGKIRPFSQKQKDAYANYCLDGKD